MCGIFGIINSKKAEFNKQAFNILGIQNDARGGDSCGIFIDGKVEYGVKTKKLYEDFYRESELLNNTNKCKIALGHCRKASIGAINEANAQPVVIRDENGKIVYVLIHNGTIYNYEDLAKKYIPEIDIKGMTDSQVMANIFYHAGYDVLGEYQGAGVFVMADYRTKNPKLLVFRGESKPSAYSKNVTQERPFYFVNNDNTFMFSSIPSYLELLLPGTEALTIISNQLIVISSKGVFKVADYDRSQRWQDRSPLYTPSTNGLSSYYSNYREDDEIDYDNIFGNYYGENKKSTKFLIPNEDMIYKINGKNAHGVYIVDKKGTIYNLYSDGCFYVFIWDGILLYDVKCYKYLNDIAEYYGIPKEELKSCCPEIINLLSPYPVKDIQYTANKHNYNTAFKATMLEEFVPYTGNVHMLFTAQSWDYKDGKKIGTLYSQGYDKAIEYYKKAKSTFVGIDTIKENIYI